MAPVPALTTVLAAVWLTRAHAAVPLVAVDVLYVRTMIEPGDVYEPPNVADDVSVYVVAVPQTTNVQPVPVSQRSPTALACGTTLIVRPSISIPMESYFLARVSMLAIDAYRVVALGVCTTN